MAGYCDDIVEESKRIMEVKICIIAILQRNQAENLGLIEILYRIYKVGKVWRVYAVEIYGNFLKSFLQF